jgi:hypothetical protein
MNPLAPLRHHPIGGFVALTCLWSFSWWTLILAVVPPGALLRGPPVPSALAFMVLGSAGPVLASLAMTVARSGRGGIQELAGRLLRWRVGRWWLVVLAPRLMNAALALAFSLGGGEVSGAAIVGKLGPAVGLEYPTYEQNLAWTAFGVAVAWLVVGATWLATSSWDANPREA